MFNIGPEELILILVIALIFVGPKRLPDMARQVGKGLREFRSLTGNAKRELMDSVAVDLNAAPQIAEEDADLPPVDIGSLPVWDGSKDVPQGGDVPIPMPVAPNGATQNGKSGGAKSGGKSKKSKRSVAATEAPTEVTEAKGGSEAPTHEVPAPAAEASPTVELPPSAAAAGTDAIEPSGAPAETAGAAETEVPTTDPVEP